MSALDPTVAARVFTQVVGNSGLLKNRVRKHDHLDLFDVFSRPFNTCDLNRFFGG